MFEVGLNILIILNMKFFLIWTSGLGRIIHYSSTVGCRSYFQNFSNARVALLSVNHQQCQTTE